jgi:acetyltransferase-like isoleucine patch superfamily enzyme
MNFISKGFRFFFRQLESASNCLRILKLKLLYPGISIDFKTTVEKNCSIICIKGGKLIIIESKISAGTQIIADQNSILKIEKSYVGRNCVIAAKEKIMINKNCLVAEMVVIRDQDHIVDTFAENKTREDFNVAPIVMKQNVWIASKATILKGVTIGEYSVITASAVINQNVPSQEVWGGVPGKFLKAIGDRKT